MKAALLVLALLAACFLLLPGFQPARAQTLQALISGPTALAPSAIAAYNVSITGGPSAGVVNYSIQYYIAGTNVSGGAPLLASPGRTNTNKTLVRVNVTAPPNEQVITIRFTVTAKDTSGTEENTTAEYTVAVLKPVLLTVTFHNAAPTAAANVSVRFYVDGVYVGSSKVARFAANGNTAVTFNYVPAGLAAGQHQVRAEADLNGDGVIQADQGEVAVSDFFYHSVQATSAGWTWLLGMGVFAIAFFAVALVRRRGQT